MPPKGWKKEDQVVTKSRYMEPTRWNKTFIPFGDRLDFLSPENQHLNTGRLRILPPRGDKPAIRE